MHVKLFSALSWLKYSFQQYSYFNTIILALRSRGRGRKAADEEEEAVPGDVVMENISKSRDVLQQSDDIRMADMDISDEGKRKHLHVQS